jgi:hypothetical protein
MKAGGGGLKTTKDLLIITGDTDDWTASELNFEKFFLHQRKK